MSEPEIADRKAAIVDLKPGDYWWCACGRSKKQPFCDGSHAGTEFSPLKFTIEAECKMALCQCKHTKHAPRCDGSHSHLP